MSEKIIKYSIRIGADELEYTVMETSAPPNYWYGGTIKIEEYFKEKDKPIYLLLVPNNSVAYTEMRAFSGLHYAIKDYNKFFVSNEGALEESYILDSIGKALYERIMAS